MLELFLNVFDISTIPRLSDGLWCFCFLKEMTQHRFQTPGSLEECGCSRRAAHMVDAVKNTW